MLINNLLASSLLVFCFTSFQVVVWGALLRKRWGWAGGEAALGALLASHLQYLATQVVLSLSLGLRPWTYVLALLAVTVALYAVVGWSGVRDWVRVLLGAAQRMCGSRWVWGWGAVFFLFGAMLVGLRGFKYYDLTWDTLSYSQPKIAFYLQNQSIFFTADAGDLRIDVNERNGELLFLHFALLTGKTQGFGLAYFWQWGSLLLGAGLMLRRFGLRDDLAALAALVLSVTPIHFAHSTLVKGDALALVYLLMALYFSSSRLELRERTLGALLALAMAVCCKFSSIFLAFTWGLLLLAAVLRAKVWPGWWRLAILALAGLLIFNKALHNFIIWGHPFKRRASEEALVAMNLPSLGKNLAQFLDWSWRAFSESCSTDFLSVGMHNPGVLLPFLVALVLWFSLRNGAKVYPKFFPEFVALLVAWAGLFYVMDLGSLAMCRFHAPIIFLLCLFLIGWLASGGAGIKRTLCLGLLLAAGALACFQDLRPTESFCHHGLRSLPKQWTESKALERRLGYASEQAQCSPEFRELQKQHARVLLAAPVDNAFFFAFGENFAWKLDPSTCRLDARSLCALAQPGDYLLLPHARQEVQFAKMLQEIENLVTCSLVYRDGEILILRLEARR